MDTALSSCRPMRPYMTVTRARAWLPTGLLIAVSGECDLHGGLPD
jgi:hypothetical protein